MSFEIIDFHTHPFIHEDNNICSNIPYCNMSAESTREIFRKLGVSRICGSVIFARRPEGISNWEITKMNNDTALKLRDMYGDFYIPGFHVHPDNVKGSCEEIERMHSLGVNLIGELVPYFDRWVNYATPEIDEIMDTVRAYGMVVSVHPSSDADMDDFVSRHPDVIIVGAHPGEYGDFERNVERMKKNENYYLDLSGYGMFRHGMLRHGIDEVGADRFIFGSDYPTCNPGMYIGGVMNDTLITDDEKEKIMYLNAKRILGI